jgi:hypothetical protein
LTSQASALCRLISFTEWLEQSCHPAILDPLLFPGKQRPAKGGCSGPGEWSYMVKLDQVPLKRSGLTPPWWIQGTISATLTVVGIDKTITKGSR